MPPENIRVSALNSTAIQVLWKPPNPQHVNGINQGYKLQAWHGIVLIRVNFFFYLLLCLKHF